MKVLLTGMTGFIGNSITYAMLDNGFEVIGLACVDINDFVIEKIKQFYKGELDDENLLRRIFKEHPDIDFVVHSLERVSISSSVKYPYEFYKENLVKSMELFKCLSELGIKSIILNSSGSIYDVVPGYQVTEESPIQPRNPFSRSKYMTELMLQDFCGAYDMRCISLRCFNAIGADPKVRFGSETQNSLCIIRKLLDATEEKDSVFKIAGSDWSTRDGTCIRDYVHIWDVANAFVAAIENFDSAFLKYKDGNERYLPINIASGTGVTVKELIFAFENITSERLNIGYDVPRAGDIAGSYANTGRAKELLNWEANLSIEEAILDTIRWADACKYD